MENKKDEIYEKVYYNLIYSRYFILKEGLYKNIKKLLNVCKQCIIIENIDRSCQEIIPYQKIIDVKFSKDNGKEFFIQYLNQQEVENVHSFLSTLRSNIITDLFYQMVLYYN